MVIYRVYLHGEYILCNLINGLCPLVLLLWNLYVEDKMLLVWFSVVVAPCCQ